MRAANIEIVEFSDEWAEDFAALNYEWIDKFFVAEKHDREILDNPRKFVIEAGGEIFMAIVAGLAAGTVAMIPSKAGRRWNSRKWPFPPSFREWASVTT